MLLLILLLIVSGTVEVNPGPAQRSIKYPCGTCEQSVYTGKSIACDSCNCWFHLQCTEMSEQMFNCCTQNVNLEWLCLKCGMPDINSTIFNSSISSEESSPEIPTKIKAKMLRIIMIVNFQGIWSKKELFENCLLSRGLGDVYKRQVHKYHKGTGPWLTSTVPLTIRRSMSSSIGIFFM